MIELRTKSAFGAPQRRSPVEFFHDELKGHFSVHDEVKRKLESLAAEFGAGKLEVTLQAILTGSSVDPLETALRGLVERHGEALVYSEMKLLDPKNVSTRNPLRQRSWGAMNSADEISQMRGKNVDIRA
jgi:hypothetical protein